MIGASRAMVPPGMADEAASGATNGTTNGTTNGKKAPVKRKEAKELTDEEITQYLEGYILVPSDRYKKVPTGMPVCYRRVDGGFRRGGTLMRVDGDAMVVNTGYGCYKLKLDTVDKLYVKPPQELRIIERDMAAKSRQIAMLKEELTDLSEKNFQQKMEIDRLRVDLETLKDEVRQIRAAMKSY